MELINTERGPRSEEELLRRLAFHERKMNDPNLPQHWRGKSEYLYWYYLDILTKPEES